jgi:hypothetical protein
MSLREPGRVVEFKTALRWRVIFPDVEHLAVSSYLRELAASDCSPSTLRSYGFDLLRWLRFLHPRMTAWERADRLDVREFVEWLRETPNPQRLRRRLDAPPPGSVNPLTGKPVLPVKYASRTINHQLSVLFGLYEFACVADLGPMVNPVPAQRAPHGGRLHAHHNPMEHFVVHRRATYRQKVPRPAWRAIPEERCVGSERYLHCAVFDGAWGSFGRSSVTAEFYNPPGDSPSGWRRRARRFGRQAGGCFSRTLRSRLVGESGERRRCRLSPLGHAHLNCRRRYTVTMNPPSGLHPLRDPSAPADSDKGW